MAAELAWALFWCEAEVGRRLCDVTWEGAFDGTINQTLQTGRGKVALPRADVNKQLLTWRKWRACPYRTKERRGWWQIEDSMIINVISIVLLPVFLKKHLKYFREPVKKRTWRFLHEQQKKAIKICCEAKLGYSTISNQWSLLVLPDVWEKRRGKNRWAFRLEGARDDKQERCEKDVCTLRWSSFGDLQLPLLGGSFLICCCSHWGSGDEVIVEDEKCKGSCVIFLR